MADTINWKEIQEKYPKAWRIFARETKYDAIDRELGLPYDYMEGRNPEVYYYNTRDLYDFFDERGIYLAVDPVEINGTNRVAFCEHVFNRWIGKAPYHETRALAEAAAFTRAFEILESRLQEESNNG